MTDSVASIVCVPKGETVRVCGDFTKVNENILRPYFSILKIELTLTSLKGAKFISKIDITLGFHHIKLHEKSKLLTTIITPFGCFVYKTLPFGINCASEFFVNKFFKVLTGIENVVHHIDNVLVYSITIEEHDATLRLVLEKLEKEGISINFDKSIFAVKKVSYLGHILSEEGIGVDPERI